MRKLLFVMALKLIAEIALMALVGQWLVGLLAGAGRETNFFYKLLGTLTGPFVMLARRVTPRSVGDRHVPIVAGAMLLSLWMVSTFFKIQFCIAAGVQACR